MSPASPFREEHQYAQENAISVRILWVFSMKSVHGKKQKKGRPSTVVTEDAIELALNMLRRGDLKYAIKNELRKKHRCSARSLETVISRAREAFRKTEGKSRKEMRVNARDRYEAIIADPATSMRDKIRAQDSLCKLFGLHVTRMVHSGTGEGGAIKTESKTTISLKGVPKEDLKSAQASLRRLRELAIGGSSN